MISDRWKIGAELERYIHPLNEQHPGVYNVCSCQVAPDTVNVQDALVIGSEQSKRFSASLSSDFHATTKKKVKSMEAINVNVKVKVMVMYFAENCQYQDEVQWAHWNHNQVTIHPISTYYTCSSQTLIPVQTFVREKLLVYHLQSPDWGGGVILLLRML